MRKQFPLAASVLALVLVMTGCAANTGATADAGPSYPVTVVVDNALANLQPVTVYITRESGGRHLLGSVESGRKGTFQYNAGNGVYTLSARRGSGQQDIVSDKIPFSGSATFTWRLPANQVIVGQ